MATASKKTTTKTATTEAVKKPSAKKSVAATPVAKKTTTAAKPAAKKVDTAKVEKAPAAARKSPPIKSANKTVSPEERYNMIATAAYFLAERRGFFGGYEMNDWITAEADIDAMLKG